MHVLTTIFVLSPGQQFPCGVVNFELPLHPFLTFATLLTSKKDMAPSAATRVFGITELAEAIFDQLEMHDLVRVTRISRTINSTIYGSKKFKQTLFLEPKAIHAELVTEEIGPISGDFDILYTIVYSEAEEEGAHVIATLNPFLGSSSQTAVDFTCIRCTIDPDYLLERVERGGTHCELMFVTQPPAKEIELEYTSQVSFKDGSTRSDECKHTTTVRCGGGVRIQLGLTFPGEHITSGVTSDATLCLGSPS